MNKYQEALFHLIMLMGQALKKEYLENEKINEYLETLKELTEEYIKLEEAYKTTDELLEKLEFAFDKACNELEWQSMELENKDSTCYRKMFKPDWKEWCLKDGSC